MDNITADVNMYYMTLYIFKSIMKYIHYKTIYDFSYEDYETSTDKQVRSIEMPGTST